MIREQIIEILKKHQHSMAGHNWLIGLDESDFILIADAILAIYEQSESNYDPMCYHDCPLCHGRCNCNTPLCSHCVEQSESKTAKTAEEILLKHIGKAYNCRSVFHNRYIAAMEEYRQQHQKESKYCDCEQPDREIGYSYCHTCHRMVSDERIELILNQGSTAQQPQKVEQEEEKPTDEMIEKWARTIRIDFATEILIEGAKAMRDGLIPKR
jgi:hypothetical protein